MYSGTVIRRGSGRIIGTHQKIDRVARRKLQSYIPSVVHFPPSREILRFEGLNGPDGIKKKSPNKDEPWHYIDPTNPEDRHILELIRGHENNLIAALTNDNRERASFEAAWLAHAITDGLTPAHHFPYKEKRDELLGDQADMEATVLKKILSSGDNWREKIKNNYEYFKPNGLGVGSAHLYFELGVALSTKAMLFDNVKLSRADREAVKSGGITSLYLSMVDKVYEMHIYDEFMKSGWTAKLAREVSNYLMPEIIHAVLLSWYYCAITASEKISQNSNKVENENGEN